MYILLLLLLEHEMCKSGNVNQFKEKKKKYTMSLIIEKLFKEKKKKFNKSNNIPQIQ